MIEEEARRKCNIGFVESDGDEVLTSLNRDLAAALLSPEVSAHPVAFEALHVLEYAAGGEYRVHFDADWENPRALT
eukprot:4224933-Prymnesium_polylepis.1